MAVKKEADAFSRVDSLAPQSAAQEWPRYYLVRARVLRRAEDTIRRRQDSHGDGGVSTSRAAVEREVHAKALPVMGRPDRVERTDEALTVVDLKSGVLADEVSPEHRRQLLMYCYLVHDEEGIWPERAAIEGVDGRRHFIDVLPTEATAVAEEAVAAMSRFNGAASMSQIEELAAPSPDSCRFCPYSGACLPFLREVDASWDMPGATFAGRASEVGALGETGVVTVDPQLGSCAPGAAVHLLRVPVAYLPAAGGWVAVTHAASTAGSSDFAPRWGTQLWVWESPPL